MVVVSISNNSTSQLHGTVRKDHEEVQIENLIPVWVFDDI